MSSQIVVLLIITVASSTVADDQMGWGSIEAGPQNNPGQSKNSGIISPERKLELEGLMNKMKNCMRRCNRDCKKESKGSSKYEDFCNGMCAVSCPTVLSNNGATMNGKEAEKKAKDELMSENTKCMHTCNTDCDRGASTKKKSCNDGCPKRCPKPTDAQIKKRAEKIIQQDADGNEVNIKIANCTNNCNVDCLNQANGDKSKESSCKRTCPDKCSKV